MGQEKGSEPTNQTRVWLQIDRQEAYSQKSRWRPAPLNHTPDDRDAILPEMNAYLDLR